MVRQAIHAHKSFGAVTYTQAARDSRSLGIRVSCSPKAQESCQGVHRALSACALLSLQRTLESNLPWILYLGDKMTHHKALEGLEQTLSQDVVYPEHSMVVVENYH